MLAIHWTPVANTKKVLRTGIRKSQNGLYCFPLTGNYKVDRWWVKFFNCVRGRKKYNGVLFRIREGDLPAYYGDWVGATSHDNFRKEITSLEQLRKEHTANLKSKLAEYGVIYDTQFAIKDSQLKSLNDGDLVTFVMENMQIVLSRSIAANRIIRVISDGTHTGRQRRKRKLYANVSRIEFTFS